MRTRLSCCVVVLPRFPLSCTWEQGPLRAGSECWVLCPRNGIKPVAEGIACSPSQTLKSDSASDQSFLMSLCEGGLQNVKVTRVYKKKVELMFVGENPGHRYLDDVVTPPAPNDTTVRWSVRYLVMKENEA